MRRLRLPATVLVVAVAVGLTPLAAPAPARVGPRPSSTTTTTWPPLPAFDTNIGWADCGDGFQCGTLTVPVDWKTTTGSVPERHTGSVPERHTGSVPERHTGSVPLALIRRPATSPADRIGALVVNYGGPGESGVDYLRATWSRLPDVVRARFDVVSFDPRGAGASRPIDCVGDAFLDLGGGIAAVPSTPDRLEAVHAFNRAFAAGCTKRMSAYAGQVGTRNVARDVEAIRIALGEPTLNYLGYSYGTILGITYAQMFPATIRAMVLDGPPDYRLAARDYAYAQAQGFMRALGAFLDWCQQQCALAGAGVPRDVLQQLIARVDQQPLTASYQVDGITRDGTLTPSLLESAVLALLYDRSRGWPLLADDLLTAVRRGWGGPLLAVADRYLGRDPGGKWSPLVEANAVITCVDRPARSTPTTAQELADIAIFQAQLPPWGGSWATAACVGMPEPARGDKLGNVRVRGAPPVLVVGTTGDPATPYAGAQALVGRIPGSQLLTFDSTEHTAFGRGISACIDGAVDAYLVDGALPTVGAHCAPD